MPRKRPDPALEASSSEDEGCFDRPGRGGDDSDEGDALDESAFDRSGNAPAKEKEKKKFTNAYDAPTDTAPSRPRGGGRPKKGYTGGPLPAGWEPVWHEPASGKGGKWKFEHASFGIVDSRAQAEQFDTKRAGPMNSWLEKKKKPSASPATADGPRASTKRPRPSGDAEVDAFSFSEGEPARQVQATLKAGGGLAKPAAPSREPTASAKPVAAGKGKGGGAKAKARGGAAGSDSDRGAPSAAAAVSASDALETLLASKRQHEKALEEMEARVEETVDHFYDQGEAGKLRVRQEFRDLYG